MLVKVDDWCVRSWSDSASVIKLVARIDSLQSIRANLICIGEVLLVQVFLVDHLIGRVQRELVELRVSEYSVIFVEVVAECTEETMLGLVLLDVLILLLGNPSLVHMQSVNWLASILSLELSHRL